MIDNPNSNQGAISRNLGLLISHLCSETGRDAKELAEHLGRSVSELNQAFTGQSPLSIDELACAAEWLDIALTSLLAAALLGHTMGEDLGATSETRGFEPPKGS